MELTKDIGYYQTRSLKVLTPEEQNLFLNADRVQISVDIMKADHDYLKSFNMQRIAFFLIHEFVEHVKAKLGEGLHD